MAISKRCKKCKAFNKAMARKCKCGKLFKTGTYSYRVAVKKPDGKWRTKAATTYELAVKLENKYKAETTEESEIGRTARHAPTFNYIWDEYLTWAKADQRQL